METYTVTKFTHLISTITGVKIQHAENPRNEADKNGLQADNIKFINLSFGL